MTVLKSLSGKGNGVSQSCAKEKKCLVIMLAKTPGRAIVAPKKQKKHLRSNKQLWTKSVKKKNLAGKTYKGSVPGWPGKQGLVRR
ncbi:MAG: hypothetical protein ACJZ2G_05610 [Thalassobaculaceae bacterium]